MRALTLTQPWAGLVVAGVKPDENRDRKVIARRDFGTRFAVHASREIDESVYFKLRETKPDLWAGGWSELAPETWPAWYRLSRITSAVIGVATVDRDAVLCQGWLYDMQTRDRICPLAERRWATGPVVYMLRDAAELARPVFCRGNRGFWTLTPDKARDVAAQLEGTV